MGNCTASNYTQPEITVCDGCFHQDVCGSRDYLSEDTCVNRAVDVAPAVRGEWERVESDGGTRFIGYQCTICDYIEAYPRPFCSNCGAHMGHD